MNWTYSAEEIGVEPEHAVAGGSPRRRRSPARPRGGSSPTSCVLELGRPELRVLGLDAVDQVDAEVEVDRLVAQDVLELLADPLHPVLAVEGEDHREAGVEEDPLHDHVVADQVLQERLRARRRSSVVKSGSSTSAVSSISSSSLAAMAGISWYMLKTSRSSRPRLSTM